MGGPKREGLPSSWGGYESPRNSYNQSTLMRKTDPLFRGGIRGRSEGVNYYIKPTRNSNFKTN